MFKQHKMLAKNRLKLALLLWGSGMAGVVSTLLMRLPISADEVSMSLTTIKLLSLIQPTLLLSLAVWVGTKLAPTVHLRAPILETMLTEKRLPSSSTSHVLYGLAGGLAGGMLLLGAQAVQPPGLEVLQEKMRVPVVTRVLYGGITEEILIRWGLMTSLLWAGFRIFQSTEGPPSVPLVGGSIVASALLFGAGHLPVAMHFADAVTIWLIAFVVLANAVFGILAGFLFWYKGLSCAIIAHMMTHLVYVLIQ